MLPKKIKLGVATFGLLLLCVNSAIGQINSSPSNVWHNGPINCYTCTSIEECSTSKGLVMKCEGNDLQTCITVFNDDGVVSQRGCSDQISSSPLNSYCTANPENCPICTSSGCNEATSLDQFTECLSCDSALDKNCVLKPSDVTTRTMCYGQCMTALYPISNGAHNLVRSCLSDRDIDERESCTDGNNGKCVACSGANCNTVALPETRHSCYRCLDEECEDPGTEECTTLSENDECFMRFDSDSNLVEMGCVSDFQNAETVVELIKNKELLVCESENCNSFNSFPKPNDCTQCSSDDLEACATKPTTVITSSSCRMVPYTQCYERVTESGITERGCLSSLEGDVFYNCLSGADSNCKPCDGNSCNEKIIPADRAVCQRCSSELDSNCHSSPTALSVCPTYSADDSCVATYENGITRRGCLSEFACKPEDKSCQICKGNGCNTADIKKRIDDIYGIFQDLPLNCNTCSGADCSNGFKNPQKCEGDVFQDCMSIFNDQGEVVRRGCETAVLAEFSAECGSNPELCFSCKSNGCNDVTDASSTQTCLYCDASSNPDCLFNPSAITTTRKCVQGCVASLYPRKSNSDIYEFVRTCYEDIEYDNRELCTEENNCVRCLDDKCNIDILPANDERLSCNHCDGDDCEIPKSQACLAYSSSDQCYMYFDNVTFSAIRMGCRSELNSGDISADIKQYFICDGNDCNDYSNLPEANLCYACNSASNVNCATNPSAVTAQSRCQRYPYTSCSTYISDDGQTVRGCVYDLPIDVFTNCNSGNPNFKCAVCTESDCNANIYPSNRQQCHRCNSDDDANCEAKPDTLQACPLYRENDACVTKWQNGVTNRGCASEMSCDGLGSQNCRSCSGNGCNSINLAEQYIGEPGKFQELPLNCYHCNGTAACLASLGNVDKCDNNKLQTCTTAFNENGEVVGRGCSDLMNSMCSGESNTCYDCKSNGCNTPKSESDFVDCLFCDGQDNADCTFNVDGITQIRKCHKSCATALYVRDRSDSEPVYELTRTCLDDMDLDDREECEAGGNANCKACTGEKCNTESLGSRKSCYQCKGDDCQDPKIQVCNAVMAGNKCFIEYDETRTVVEMGCRSKYDSDEVDILLKAKQLWLCDEDNCNTFDNLPAAQSCSLCNSVSDRNCAIDPASVQSFTTCAATPYTQCYSQILQSGHTQRGCVSDLEDDVFLNCYNNKNTTECSTCTGNNCNKDLYPSDRLLCNVCSASEQCDSAPNSSQACLLYNAGEKCVSAIDNNGQTVRGCSSQVICDPSDSANCQICEGNTCNVQNLKRKSDGKPGQWQELPLSCLTCANLEDCKSSAREETCPDTGYCMTVFNNNGEVTTRGCSSAVEASQATYCDSNSDKCFNCNSNQCNRAVSLTDYVDCIYCDSQTNSDCALNPNGVGRRRTCYGSCMTALHQRANSSVYELIRSCLDDKDIADQEICSSGGSEECKACVGSACNSALLPETRLSCNSCLGSNCEDPEPATCANYMPADQCFMYFDSDGDIKQMGCLSDLDDDFVAGNINNLFMCNTGDNCNSFDNMPSSHICAECSSADDEDCAANPASIPNVVQCSALPNTQCYAKVNVDGTTDRGCISSLTTAQIVSCLSGNSNDCSVCTGDRCNVEIFPADRLTCHRCNTNEDPSCESSPDAASACPVYSENQYCTAKLVNGHTYRGCSTEFQCDQMDKQHCRHCNSSNCNTADLSSSAIGYPGMWQGAPINCYACQGEDCHNSMGTVGKCEGNILQNCATVFAENGTIVERGCTDQIYAGDNANYCDQNPGYCKFCKSNGCNTATSLADYGDCLICDGSKDTDCIFNPSNIKTTRTCHKGCMTGMYPRKNEENPAYELARGCLDDLDLDDREDCASGDKSFCQACTGSSCNTALIPEVRLKCFVCNGDDCDDAQSAECTSFREADQCLILFEGDNDIKRMGCASDYDNSDLVANRRQLWLCSGDDCNSYANLPTTHSCRWCNSTENPDCASNPAISDATVCHLFSNTECVTLVDRVDGSTARGCLSDVSDDIYDDCISGTSSFCQICDSNDCNNKIFPDGRSSCLQCDSALFPACVDNPQSFAGICPKYSENEKCVTKLEGNRVIRGCASEMTCDTSDRDTCRICNGTDNCNSINLLDGFIGEPGRWQALPLNCYKCEGDECDSGLGSVGKCENGNTQVCGTVFNADGKVIKRDCSDAVAETHEEYCDQNEDKCFQCKSNGCNNAQSVSDYVDCYFCDSEMDATCAVDFSPIASTRTRKCHKKCMVALYPRSSSSDPSYELTRSCLDDMDMDEREACANGENDHCAACEGSRCNTMKLPEEPFECYKCVGDDCEDMESLQCSAYHPNDECYIIFDSDNSISKMGCRSEFEPEAVVELVKQKSMLLCAGANCNSPAALPTPKTCSVCNSENNPLCATNPNLVGNSERCAALPYTDCATRVDASGHTIRDCLSSLDSEAFYGCLMQTDGLCQTCTGDKCNEIDVFPAERPKCQQCDSATDATCATAPNSNKVCPVYNEKDTCVTNMRNGRTTRGCSSSMKCDDETDRRTCRICEGNGCNTVNLEKVSEDGEPGRWQDLPITCYTCNGVDNCESKGDFRSCVNNIFQSCMTEFNAAGKVSQRGCSDVVEQNNPGYCEANPEKCMRCHSNGCNTATSLDDYIDCLSCDTDANGDCVNNVAAITKTRKCHKSCMTALYPRFKEDNPSYGLSRSCSDDMDMDDRNSCLSGDKEFCQTCSSDNCNTVAMPDDGRQSCLQCKGNECQDPSAQLCTTYRETDACYIQFDVQPNVVAMGCRSEFSNAEADYLLKQKRLFLCDSDDCNTFENIPQSQTCVLCNSRTDANCAVNPSAVASSTNCAAVPIVSCYSRVLSDGVTERGCLSNLQDDEFLGCFNGTSATCSSCAGDSCNKEVFPEKRLKCHICDSSVDSSCEATPDSLGVCPLYDPLDTCLTSFSNGKTLRGCSSNLLCDVTNPTSCVKCSGEGCNTVNLAKKQDDNYGKWQDLPLTCLSCKDSDCDSSETTLSEVCTLNNEQDCLTVFGADGKVVRRGCADIVDQEYDAYCDENDDSCYNCKSNNCNTATAKSEFNDCIYCNSFKDLQCLWNPTSTGHNHRKCQGACMTALFPSDNSETPSYDVIRTCLNDKEVSDQTSCVEGGENKCKSCTGDDCNTDIIPSDRLSCYTCDGDNCMEPTTELCSIYKEVDQCFIWFDDSNSVSQMGCLSSFRNQDLASIIKTKKVYTCSGDNCNTLNNLPTSQTCAVCDSVDDINCAIRPTEIGDFATCNSLPYTDCFSKLTESGTTTRGCLTDLPGDDFAACVLGTDKNCGICQEDGCNRAIHPADRQQCYTCNSKEEQNCESFPVSRMPCAIVSDTEFCVTALIGNDTLRGCKSDIHCDSNDLNTCRSCLGTECNGIDLVNRVDDGYHGVWQELPLKCHTCSGADCLNSLGPAYECTSENNDCMTVFNEVGEVLRRGCTDNVEDYMDLYCRLNPSLCFKCKSNECNAAWSPSEFIDCSFCDSDNDALCVINPENSGFATRKCYKECMVAMQEQRVIRSCLDDKELRTQHECQADDSGKECASCTGNNCNKFVFPADRLKCHICTGTSCSSSVGQYCTLYEDTDYCFAKYEDNRVNLMGCASSQNKTDLEQWQQENRLYTCSTADCNELSRLPAAGGECLLCDSSKTPSCLQNPLSVVGTETCDTPFSECVTFIDEQGHTRRSCFSSLSENEKTCEARGTCAKCSGDRCNSEKWPANRRSCIICNSRDGTDCVKNPTNSQICPIYVENDSCTTTLSGDGYLERGCSSRVKCANEHEDYCQVCHTDSCNTVELKGSAGLVSNSLLLTLVLAIISVVLVK